MTVRREKKGPDEKDRLQDRDRDSEREQARKDEYNGGGQNKRTLKEGNKTEQRREDLKNGRQQ